jgi:hypothetical protein
MANGKLEFVFLPEQYEHAHNTVPGKLMKTALARGVN